MTVHLAPAPTPRPVSALDGDAFLARIGLSRPLAALAPTVEVLRALHRGHVSHVPFENADVIARRPLRYGLGELYEKIVVRRRGGWCLETNWLLVHVLRRLGFTAAFVGARIADTNRFKGPLSHAVAVVEAEGGRFLADTGFGWGSFVEPLPLENGTYTLDGIDYRVAAVEGDEHLVHRRLDGVWRPMYQVVPRPRTSADFAETSAFHETSDRSPFHRELVCARYTTHGWALLRGDQLTLLSGGRTRKWTLPGPDEPGGAAEWILRGGPEPAVVRDVSGAMDGGVR